MQPGKDPEDYLLELIGPAAPSTRASRSTDQVWNYGEPFETYPIDTGRLRKRGRARRQGGGMGQQLPKGQGLGIAAHRSFVTYVATVVHVEVGEKGKITFPRVDIAIDCGFCVQSRAGALADRGRRGHGPDARQI